MAHITSEPAKKWLTLIDIDIRFQGELTQITLRPEDTETVTSNSVIFEFVTGEVITVFTDKILWVSRRTRTVELPPDPTDEPAHRKA